MEKIFTRIANENNTTEAKVKEEMADAIKQAMENSAQNHEAASFWEALSGDGNTPEPEDVVKAIVARLISQTHGPV